MPTTTTGTGLQRAGAVVGGFAQAVRFIAHVTAIAVLDRRGTV